MESIDQILNPTEGGVIDEEMDTGQVDTETDDEATGETSQVAAEKAEADVSSAQIKAELSALAQERARVRQKEASLDEERARLATTTGNATQSEAALDAHAELKELRKQHRNALLNGVDDVECDALEDKMEELRLSIFNQRHQATTAQDRVASEFNTVYAAVHDEFPFLSVDHPEVNPELNEDINAHYLGRVQKGDSPAVALRKAVDRFAPAYVKDLGDDVKDEVAAVRSAAEKTRKAEADRLVREKLGRGGFSEVRSVGKSQATKPFSGPTPMGDILKKAS